MFYYTTPILRRSFIGDILHNLSGIRNEETKILIVISLVIIAFAFDTYIIRISDLYHRFSDWWFDLFIVISAVSWMGQYFVVRLVKKKSKTIRTNELLHLDVMHRAIVLIQSALSTILLFVILQMILGSIYNTLFLTISTLLSYSLAVVMMGLLTWRFFSWFKSYRSFLILLYGLASAAISINAGLTLAFVDTILVDKPIQIRPHLQTSFIYPPHSFLGLLDYTFVISSVVSFLLTWIATAFLLYHHSQTMGMVRYWIVLSIPLVYFLSQFLNLFAPLFQQDPIFFGILFTVLFSFTKIAGGILFGIAFWTLTRKIPKDNAVKDYMTIAAYGLVILFISNQAIVVSSAHYPPFGLVTVSYMGLSSYLILVGIYASAISVAENAKLRQSIRKLALKESKLLDSIGSAEVEQEVLRKAIPMIRKHQSRMIKEAGIKSSLEEADVKEYLNIVLKEVNYGKDKEKPST